VTTSSQQPPVPYTPAEHPPAACLIALAGTPDDTSWIDCQLLTIAQFSADLITPVAYASVTAYREGAVTTVATGNEIALAVDRAQYDDQDGPCLEALDTASPIAVPDVAATIRWPGFRDSAYRLGITASLSIPLFAGRGTAIAALNLYSRDPNGLAPLAAAVRTVYDPEVSSGTSNPRGDVDHGGQALIDGLVGAFAVRDRIQQAIGMVIATTHRAADAAYLIVRNRAAETGATLGDTANAIITEQQ
jgi:hypothetical protein